MSRRLTLYRDDSTVQVVFDRVKSVFWTAGNTVLVVAQFTGNGPEHRYVHWPRERFCWFKDEPSPPSATPTLRRARVMADTEAPKSSKVTDVLAAFDAAIQASGGETMGNPKAAAKAEQAPAQPSRTNSVGMGDERFAKGTLDRQAPAQAKPESDAQAACSADLGFLSPDATYTADEVRAGYLTGFARAQAKPLTDAERAVVEAAIAWADAVPAFQLHRDALAHRVVELRAARAAQPETALVPYCSCGHKLSEHTHDVDGDIDGCGIYHCGCRDFDPDTEQPDAPQAKPGGQPTKADDA